MNAHVQNEEIKKKNEERCHLSTNNLHLKHAQLKCFLCAQVKEIKRGMVFGFDEWDSQRKKRRERVAGL